MFQNVKTLFRQRQTVKTGINTMLNKEMSDFFRMLSDAVRKVSGDVRKI